MLLWSLVYKAYMLLIAVIIFAWLMGELTTVQAMLCFFGWVGGNYALAYFMRRSNRRLSYRKDPKI